MLKKVSKNPGYSTYKLISQKVVNICLRDTMKLDRTEHIIDPIDEI